jgi:phage shock protein A
MARMKSITSIDAGISKVEKEIQQTKARYDKLTGELEKLQNEKRDYEAKTIMDAFIRSGKSLDEVMTFLQP